MDLKQFVYLIKALKGSGVQYIKTTEFEIHMDSYVHQNSVAKKQQDQMSFHIESEDHPTFVKYENSKKPEKEKIPHIIEDLKSLMKMSDQELVERLFPLPQDEQPGDDV